MTRWITILICLIILVTRPGDAQIYSDLNDNIEKIILHDTDFSFETTPGYAIGVVIDEENFSFHYGDYEKVDSSIFVNSALFHLGGLSKALIATLMDQLLIDGSIDTSLTIGEVFDRETLPESSASISLHQLLTHTSGLPRFPNNLNRCQESFSDPYADYGFSCLMDFLKEYDYQSPKPLYSDLNYAILHEILGELTADPDLDQRIRTHWSSMGFHPKQPSKRDSLLRLNPGIDRKGKISEPMHFQSFEGSIGMTATMQEMINFLTFLLSQRDSPGFHPYVEAPYERGFNLGHAWHIADYNKTSVLMHAGREGGHYAYMAMTPETNRGVVVLANSEAGTEDLGILILRLINRNWRLGK